MAGEDALSPLEDSLRRRSASWWTRANTTVRELRLYFQHASQHAFIDAVEGITGRKVRGFVSGMEEQPPDI